MNSRSGNRPLASGVPMRYEGAALTEFVVLCIAMVPLMFAVPMLGNLIDAKQASIQAGRYATWEATVHPSRQDSAVVLKDRFFTDEESQILSLRSSRLIIYGEAIQDARSVCQPILPL